VINWNLIIIILRFLPEGGCGGELVAEKEGSCRERGLQRLLKQLFNLKFSLRAGGRKRGQADEIYRGEYGVMVLTLCTVTL